MTFFSFRICFLIAAVGAGLAASTTSGQPSPAAETPLVPDYRIRAYDRISLAVFGQADLNVMARVDAKGIVHCALIGPVKVAGLTVQEATETIARAYRQDRMLAHPEVTIAVEEYAPRYVTVQGQIKVPGVQNLPVESAVTVLESVNRAGGPTATGNLKKVRLTRTMPDGSSHVYTFDLSALTNGTGDEPESSTALKFLVEPGDLIFVPERQI